jgi:repressor LexA
MNYTPRQLQVLRLIHEYQQKYHYSPTYAELARQLGVSTITVFEHLESLERKGAIQRRRHEARSVEIVDPGFLREQNARKMIPIQGVLVAGKPLGITAKKEEAPLGELVPFSSRTFLLRVRGNHLVSFHILDGDYLVVEERLKASAGEQVVAELVDGSVTVGISTGNGTVSLPGSLSEQPILADWTRLHGVVRGLLRRSSAKTQLAGGLAG